MEASCGRRSQVLSTPSHRNRPLQRLVQYVAMYGGSPSGPVPTRLAAFAAGRDGPPPTPSGTQQEMDPQFYAAAIPAVIILGLSKGGFVGLGNLAIPLMALVMSPVQAAAVLLPILLVQDAVGVLSFRRSWDGFNLAVLLPSAFVGIFLGYLLAAHVSDAGIAFSVGVISIIFGLRRLIVERRASGATALRPGIPFGLLCGVGAGFTSMIAHAGGPPFQIYVMPQRLPRDVLVGTSIIFFAAVNLVKVAPYFALGQFTRENLILSATLVPLAIVSTWAGVWLVRRISGERFYTLVYVLMVLVGLRLIWQSGPALFGA